MKTLLYLLLAACPIMAVAQDETVRKLKTDSEKTIKKEKSDNDTIPRIWRTGGVLNLNLSQSSLNNWAAGGDDFALSLNTLFSVYAFYKKDKHSWDNTLDVNFGYIKTSSLGSRKNDDRIDLLSKYGYSVSEHWNLSGLFNFRSQALPGYSYSDSDRTRISSFLAPGYFLLSLGMDYKNDNFSVFISPITARRIYVLDDSLSAKGLYGVKPGDSKVTEIGAFLSANYLKEFNANASYKGRLDLFSNYLNHPEYVDVYMSNIFAIKLTKLLTATWNLDLIYDHDVKLFGKNKDQPAVQLKSLVGVGFQFRF